MAMVMVKGSFFVDTADVVAYSFNHLAFLQILLH